MGIEGVEEKDADKGVGVGAPGLNEEASGSIKEKKLWDSECLWWCPLRDVRLSGDPYIPAEPGRVALLATPFSVGLFPPKVNPACNSLPCCKGAVDMIVSGASFEFPISISCAPSSEIDAGGNGAPGRGK